MCAMIKKREYYVIVATRLTIHLYPVLYVVHGQHSEHDLVRKCAVEEKRLLLLT